MADIWTFALPVLVVDVANPVLLAAVILALSTDRPYGNSLALLAGHTLAYFLAGALLLYGVAELLAAWMDPLLNWYRNPEPQDYAIGLAIGVALLVIALRWKISPPRPSEEPPQPARGGLVASFAFGAVINFVGIPFALPYFAFIGQLMKLDGGQMVPLVLYNLGYALPFLLVPLALRLFGRAVMPVLARINAWVERAAAYIMPVLLGILGAILAADAAMFFATGTGLL